MARAPPPQPGRGPAGIGADRPGDPDLPVRHAVVLGGLQGVAELLPLSSSGHLTLVPALLDWPYARLDPDLRKAFEVAVHAGSALGLAGTLREDVAHLARELDVREALGAALALAPPALVGLALERRFDERLSRPRTVAGAQMAAGLALLVADRRPAERPRSSAGAHDHLVLGLAQTAALLPGVSRDGAALTGARVRRFTRPAAARLSREAALPVLAGAALLKGLRLGREGLPAGLGRPFGAGLAAAALSTRLGRRLPETVARAASFAPLGAYRVALGLLVLARLGRRERRAAPG